MRGEPDFEAYVAARGATVIRCLLLLGHDLAEAEETAAEAFASLRSDWRDVVDSADPDVALWATTLAVDARRRRRRHDEAAGGELVARVLRGPVGLEELQVCEVLDTSVPRLRAMLAVAPADDKEADPAEPVFPVPYARVRAVATRQRRRRWALSAGVAATIVLTVALGTVLSRPERVLLPGDALPAAPAAEVTNPAGVVWWAGGELHLPGSVVRVDDVRRLVAAGPGAAYVDGDGRLVGVGPDGRRTLMGHPADRSALVSSPRLGLVAWADASVPGVTRMVVWDVVEAREVAAVVTRPRVRPITFDGGWLRFGQGLRDWAWDPSGGPAQLTGDGSAEETGDRTALVDAVAGTRLEQMGTFLRVVRAGTRGEALFPGFGGSLSADGRLVLTGPDPGRQPRLYDARTEERLDAWGPSQHIRGALFTAADRITWLIEQDGELALITCGPEAYETCSDFVELGEPDRVLLAGDSTR